MTHMTTFEERGNALPRFLVQGYLDPAEVGDAVEKLIALLDVMQGDPDLEDATDAEDEGIGPIALGFTSGPGCDVSDAGEYAGDEEDGNFAEDECAAKFARMKNGPGCTVSDPDSGTEDTGEETDAEDSFILPHYSYTRTDGPGCSLSDPGMGDDGGY